MDSAKQNKTHTRTRPHRSQRQGLINTHAFFLFYNRNVAARPAVQTGAYTMHDFYMIHTIVVYTYNRCIPNPPVPRGPPPRLRRPKPVVDCQSGMGMDGSVCQCPSGVESSPHSTYCIHPQRGSEERGILVRNGGRLSSGTGGSLKPHPHLSNLM